MSEEVRLINAHRGAQASTVRTYSTDEISHDFRGLPGDAVFDAFLHTRLYMHHHFHGSRGRHLNILEMLWVLQERLGLSDGILLQLVDGVWCIGCLGQSCGTESRRLVLQSTPSLRGGGGGGGGGGVCEAEDFHVARAR